MNLMHFTNLMLGAIGSLSVTMSCIVLLY